jgi:hypothetical protein
VAPEFGAAGMKGFRYAVADADAKAHRITGRPEMCVLGLAFAVLLAITVPIAAHADGPRSKMGPASAGPALGVVLAWDGGGGWAGTRGLSAAKELPVILANGTANGRRIGGQAVFLWRVGSLWRAGGPVVLVWDPSGGAFDYPFSDWRGPTGGWGNP